MQGKKGLVFFALVITGLCLFYLSFTFVAKGIENDRAAYADAKKNEAIAAGKDNTAAVTVRKEAYLAYKDSIWNKEVYFDWTFADVKKFELNLGLDLQGGMHITLMVDAKEFLEGKSGYSKNVKFNKALATAKKEQQTSTERYTHLFYKAWLAENDDEKGLLAKTAFYSRKNQSDIKPNDDDAKVMSWLNAEIEEAATLSKDILGKRIDEFGATQPIIEVVASTGRIEIELPGVDDEERIKKRLSAAAQLKFLEVMKPQESANLFQQLYTKFPTETVAVEPTVTNPTPEGEEEISLTEEEVVIDDSLTGETIAVVETDNSTVEPVVEAKTREQIRLLIQPNMQQDPQTGRIAFASYAVLRKDKKELVKFLKRKDVLGLFPKGSSIYFGKVETRATGADEADVIPVYFCNTGRNGMPLMGGQGTPDYVDDARQDYTQQAPVRPNILISFNSEGDAAWAKATKKAADNGFAIAIVLDDIVYSAPNVSQQILGGGNTEVTGDFSMDEAQELASVLKSGKLRVTTTIEGIVVVGPSLGAEAVNRGLLSLASGLAVVIIFMMMYYGKGGTIANVALLFNIFFILGILSVPSLGAALTLPGIAGIVLTMGMSIDANVLIFERIKEEIKNGVAVKSAIQIGYKKAFVTILDANITTLITAIILFTFGTGVVKGFATTLIIGVLCSFFSAVYITRLIIEFIMNRNADAKMSFHTSISKNWFSKINFDIISKRKTAYLISALVITVGMSTVIYQGGLNLGVDFQGGRSYIVKFDKDVKVAAVRADLDNALGNEASCEVKTFDGDQNVQIKTNYMLNSTEEKADSIVQATILNGLVSFSDFNPQVVQSIKVNPTISADIKEKSLLSVLISLVAIFLYIRVRFKKWQFGVGALVALFHDVLVVISVFAIARLFGVSFEIDSIFIASMLTIVGYSVNDTVVVFDRLREFLGRNAKVELAPLFNEAINSTMSRTVMTSLTTLVVVAILLMFGGDALRGFSFALFIGIIVGTYSSIFIATPVVLDTSKKTILEEDAKVKAKKEAKENEEEVV